MSEELFSESQTTSVFKVFLFTDIEGSTDLKRRLGDVASAQLIARHDKAFRELLVRYEGHEEKESGDSFLATFDLPSNAVRCALAFQKALAGITDPEPLKVRIGIHMGEFVRVAEGGTGMAQDKLIGLAVDTAARTMSLGTGGQILMTRGAFDSARQQVLAAPDGSPVRWLAHGPYLVKGLDEPVEIYEVGVEGLSVLQPPPDSAKAKRGIAPGDDETLGWRPAVGLTIPGREGWKLERKLGEGGFGEVWIARHMRTRDVRTFKFCFKADRLRTLKRELTLFRLIKEMLGERPDIARLFDVRLDAAPYYLEMEYTAGGSLSEWARERGGVNQIPLPTRLKLVIQVAEALDAAHSIGVLHKDVKPGNVLIHETKEGDVQARLTDFGIGQIMSRQQLEEVGITASAFQTKGSTVLTDLGSRTGTRLYMAPELTTGRQPSAQSDIYALGVMAYQMVLGDLDRPMGQGWERDIFDELLREDIARCVDVEPSRRYPKASEFVELLKTLEPRRRQREQERRAKEAADKARRQRRLLVLTSVAAVLLVSAAVTFVTLRQKATTLQEQIVDTAERTEQDRREQEQRLAGLLAWRPALPPEFLAESDLAEYERVDRLRRGLETDAAKSLVDKIGEATAHRNKLQELTRGLGRPEIRFTERSRTVYQTSRETGEAALWVENNHPREAVRQEFQYRVRLERRQGAGGTSEVPVAEFEVRLEPQGPATRIELRGLTAPAEYVARVVGEFRSRLSDARYETPAVEFPFRLDRVEKVVNIDVVEAGRRWRLINDPNDRPRGFAAWEWLFRHESGQEFPAPAPTRNQADFILDDAMIEELPEGRYFLICRADGDFLSVEDAQRSWLVDRTPPTLTLVDSASPGRALEQVAFLPEDPSRTLRLVAADNLAEPGSLRFFEQIEADTFEPIESPEITLRWQSPVTGQAVRQERRAFQARDPAATRREHARSALVPLTVFSVARPTAQMLAQWQELESQITARPERYRRTNRLIPSEAPEAIFAGEAEFRAWLEGSVADRELWDRLQRSYESRRQLKGYDDAFEDRRQFLAGVIETFGSERREAMKIELDNTVVAWQETPDPAMDPLRHLGGFERRLLPPVPNDGTAFRPVRPAERPLDSHVEIVRDYAAQFGARAQYRYRLTPETPPSREAELGSFLEQSPRLLTEGPVKVEGVELIKPLTLIIQTYLKVPDSDQTLQSEARAYLIEPLVAIDPQASRRLEAISGLARKARQEAAGRYARTAAWLARERWPFLKADGEADVLWLIENAARAEALGQLERAQTDLERYEAGDEAFETVKGEQVAANTLGWSRSHVEGLQAEMQRRWLDQPATAEAGTYAREALRDYRQTRAANLLEPPKLLREAVLAGSEAPTLARDIVGSLDNLFLAWGGGGDLPGSEAAAWPAREQAGGLEVRQAPAGVDSATLAMRFERDDGGVHVASPWVRIAEWRADRGVTLAEASALAQAIMAALPRKGSSGLEDYLALFKAGESGESNSAIVRTYSSTAMRRAIDGGLVTLGPMTVQSKEAETTFVMELEVRGGRGTSRNAYRLTLEKAAGKVLILRDEAL